MMVLNKIQYDAICMALQGIDNELGLNIYSMNHFCDPKPIAYGVNWAAKGTQDVVTTLEYAKNLTQAAEIAEALNSLEIKVDYKIKVDEDSFDFDKFRTNAAKLRDVLKIADTELIQAALTKWF